MEGDGFLVVAWQVVQLGKPEVGLGGINAANPTLAVVEAGVGPVIGYCNSVKPSGPKPNGNAVFSPCRHAPVVVV